MFLAAALALPAGAAIAQEKERRLPLESACPYGTYKEITLTTDEGTWMSLD